MAEPAFEPKFVLLQGLFPFHDTMVLGKYGMSAEGRLKGQTPQEYQGQEEQGDMMLLDKEQRL